MKGDTEQLLRPDDLGVEKGRRSSPKNLFVLFGIVLNLFINPRPRGEDVRRITYGKDYSKLFAQFVLVREKPINESSLSTLLATKCCSFCFASIFFIGETHNYYTRPHLVIFLNRFLLLHADFSADFFLCAPAHKH